MWLSRPLLVLSAAFVNASLSFEFRQTITNDLSDGDRFNYSPSHICSKDATSFNFDCQVELAMGDLLQVSISSKHRQVLIFNSMGQPIRLNSRNQIQAAVGMQLFLIAYEGKLNNLAHLSLADLNKQITQWESQSDGVRFTVLQAVLVPGRPASPVEVENSDLDSISSFEVSVILGETKPLLPSEDHRPCPRKCQAVIGCLLSVFLIFTVIGIWAGLDVHGPLYNATHPH